MDISELLAFVVKNKASDLHLSSGLPPMIRVHGDIRRINLPAMEHKDVHAMVYDIMNDGQRKFYEENLECDFSFAIPNLARFRVNAFVQHRGAGAVFRTIPSKVLTLEDLKAPKIFQDISDQPRGLVLVTGPTGSGKSTTLAAMVNYINENEYGHILTVEDPIEFVHESKKSLINQREVGPHTLSFANALRSALREDPDVILVGDVLEDLRCLEVLEGEHLGGNGPEDRSRAALLHEGVHPESGKVRDGEREVALQVFLVELALAVVHDVVHHRVHVLVLQRGQVDPSHVAVHADHGGQPGRQVQVGGLVLDHEG